MSPSPLTRLGYPCKNTCTKRPFYDIYLSFAGETSTSGDFSSDEKAMKFISNIMKPGPGLLMSDFQILDWDSNFFNFPVARIILARLGEDRLRALLDELGEMGVELVYWASDSRDMGSARAASALDGFLADRKTSYVKEIGAGAPDELELCAVVEEYTKDKTDDDLRHLALLSGTHSRYNLDPKVTHHQFEALYTQWIENSVNRSLAKVVFVIPLADRIIGMITLGEKNGRGDIGLLAVDVPMRGKGFGRALLKVADAWFQAQSYTKVQVVTQGGNLAACRLYENCGYRQEKVENFYHFWLSGQENTGD